MCRPSSLFKERPLKGEAQSIIINLFEVKPEFSQIGETPLCNNTVAQLRAGPSEISKSRLGCAGSETVHLHRQTQQRCSVTLFERDSKAENCQQPLSYSM
jgi:hypothetical protein